MSLINIPKNKLKNFYFIISDELFFLIEIKNKILTIIFDGKPDDSSVVVFDFADNEKKINFDDITEEIQTDSLFSEKKVLIIKPIEEIENEIFEKLISLAFIIPENKYILFIGNDIKKIRKKEISEENIIYISSNDTDKIKKYFFEYIKSNNKEIDDSVFDLICAEADFDPYLIKNEIDKIIFYIGDKKLIEMQDFDKVKGIEKEYDIWALINAILNNEEKKAFLILEKIYDSFEPEFILGSIFNSIKRIFNIIYYLKVKRLSQDEIVNKIGKSAYFLIKQTKNFEGIAYTDIIDVLKEADLKIKKSGRQNIKIIFTLMLEKLFEKIAKK